MLTVEVCQAEPASGHFGAFVSVRRKDFIPRCPEPIAGILAAVSKDILEFRVDESAAEVYREVGQVSFAVCKALVAHARGRARRVPFPGRWIPARIAWLTVPPQA